MGPYNPFMHDDDLDFVMSQPPKRSPPPPPPRPPMRTIGHRSRHQDSFFDGLDGRNLEAILGDFREDQEERRRRLDRYIDSMLSHDERESSAARRKRILNHEFGQIKAPDFDLVTESFDPTIPGVSWKCKIGLHAWEIESSVNEEIIKAEQATIAFGKRIEPEEGGKIIHKRTCSCGAIDDQFVKAHKKWAKHFEKLKG